MWLMVVVLEIKFRARLEGGGKRESQRPCKPESQRSIWQPGVTGGKGSTKRNRKAEGTCR
jgi:hypothetical protein